MISKSAKNEIVVIHKSDLVGTGNGILPERERERKRERERLKDINTEREGEQKKE